MLTPSVCQVEGAGGQDEPGRPAAEVPAALRLRVGRAPGADGRCLRGGQPAARDRLLQVRHRAAPDTAAVLHQQWRWACGFTNVCMCVL